MKDHFFWAEGVVAQDRFYCTPKGVVAQDGFYCTPEGVVAQDRFYCTPKGVVAQDRFYRTPNSPFLGNAGVLLGGRMRRAIAFATIKLSG